MEPEQEEQGNAEIAEIIKKWKQLYSALMKFKISKEFHSLIPSIECIVNELREQEERFLQRMFYLGQSIHEEAEQIVDR
ncbi:hypothetical protein D3C76_1510240 [compost metagenome]